MSTTDPEVAQALRRAQIGLQSRSLALAIYSALGIEVGSAMIFGGTLAIIESAIGPWARIPFGLVALFGGIAMLLGVLKGDRTPFGWWSALVGAITLVIWGFTLSTIYGIVLIQEGGTLAWPPTIPIDPTVPRLFVPFLYQNLGILLALHVITLIRMGRPRKNEFGL